MQATRENENTELLSQLDADTLIYWIPLVLSGFYVSAQDTLLEWKPNSHYRDKYVNRCMLSVSVTYVVMGRRNRRNFTVPEFHESFTNFLPLFSCFSASVFFFFCLRELHVSARRNNPGEIGWVQPSTEFVIISFCRTKGMPKW